MTAEKTSFPKDKIRVLLLENIHPQAVDLFKSEQFQVERIPKLSEEELIAKIPSIHIIGLRSKTKLTPKVLSAAKKLIAIGCFCIGTDQTDLEFAAEQGIAVFNSPFSNTRSVAEVVLSNIIALSRHISDDNLNMHKGIWKKSAKGKNEVRGKTLGIVGYGHVGSQLSVLSESMGMHVQYYDHVPKLALGNASPVNSLEELLRTSDFVSLHVPYTQSTHEMITANEIAMMRKGSYLINYARGKVAKVPDVAEALKAGHLAGAAWDVFPKEPAPGIKEFYTELQGCPNTILTPHIGGSTEEAQEAIGLEVATKLVNFMNNGSTVSSVNFPEVDLPNNPNVHRIVNVHWNVPGVLKEFNEALSKYNINAQMVATKGKIGVFMCHIDTLNTSVSVEAKDTIANHKHSIRTRVLF